MKAARSGFSQCVAVLIAAGADCMAHDCVRCQPGPRPQASAALTPAPCRRLCHFCWKALRMHHLERSIDLSAQLTSPFRQPQRRPLCSARFTLPALSSRRTCRCRYCGSTIPIPLPLFDSRLLSASAISAPPRKHVQAFCIRHPAANPFSLHCCRRWPVRLCHAAHSATPQSSPSLPPRPPLHRRATRRSSLRLK